MIGMDDYAVVGARRAAIASMTAIENGDRVGWLALFADDALVADPVGVSPLDPAGEGHRGAEAIAAFYDTIIAQASISFAIRESYLAGDECANVGTITSRFPDGSAGIVDGVYTYRIDEAGQIISLRAHWEYEAMRFEPAPG